MKKANFNITVPHLFSPIYALLRNSRSYVITLRFKFHETLQINQSNSHCPFGKLIVSINGVRINVCFMLNHLFFCVRREGYKFKIFYQGFFYTFFRSVTTSLFTLCIIGILLTSSESAADLVSINSGKRYFP